MKESERMDLGALRESYNRDGLREEELPSDPVRLLRQWFEEAIQSGVTEPNAMSLATVDEAGRPDVRTVLLKEIEESAVTFYTNYRSLKARQLASVPFTAASFWWPELARQIRLRGEVSRVSRKESEAYFATRPRESQIGAWASEQSRVLSGRRELEESVREAERRFEGRDVPVPDEWGGYRIRLGELEFWQGRPGRLHDRIRYCRANESESDEWLRERLSP